MFDFDDTTARMAEAIGRYTRERLALDPVPLDRSRSREELEHAAPSMIDEDGNDPLDVLAVFERVLAPSVVSADSTRFMAMIPAAPTKASLLFDSVVSASSLNGISWLEASGAVHAENQVLRWIADLAGLGPSAGGCFVSGGTAANLSALVVARDLAMARQPERSRWRAIVADSAHSSIGGALRVIGVEPVVVTTIDGRLTGDGGGRSARHVRRRVRGRGDGGDDQRRDHRRPGRGGGQRPERPECGSTSTAPTEEPPSCPSARVRCSTGSSSPTRSWSIPTSGCSRRSTAPRSLYREPRLAKTVHTQDAAYLDAIHENVDEWNPTDYALHLTRRARGLALWYSLSVHGVGAYRRAVERGLDLAQFDGRSNRSGRPSRAHPPA